MKKNALTQIKMKKAKMDKRLKEMGDEYDNLFRESFDKVKADKIQNQKKKVRQISEPAEDSFSSDNEDGDFDNNTTKKNDNNNY